LSFDPRGLPPAPPLLPILMQAESVLQSLGLKIPKISGPKSLRSLYADTIRFAPCVAGEERYRSTISQARTRLLREHKILQLTHLTGYSQARTRLLREHKNSTAHTPYWLLAGRKGGRLQRREVCFRNPKAPAKSETVMKGCMC
jgi:hypothetical protein